MCDLKSRVKALRFAREYDATTKATAVALVHQCRSVTGRAPAEPVMQWVPAGHPHEWHDKLCRMLEQPNLAKPLPDCDLSSAEVRVLAWLKGQG